MEAGITMMEATVEAWNPFGVPLEPKFGRFESFYESKYV